jgi:hypothetical protein
MEGGGGGGLMFKDWNIDTPHGEILLMPIYCMVHYANKQPNAHGQGLGNLKLEIGTATGW